MKKKAIILPLIAGITILVFGTSCDRNKKRDLSSLPEDVRPVAEAIIEDSPEKFASAISYPVERPYPLKNIKDSAEMVKYYPKIVDKKLKKAVEESPDSLWQENGWRGWTLGNGSYFYIDSGKIYSMDYVSDEENVMLDSLRHEEISTLEPSMQAGWTPVMCVVDTVSDAVFRIDASDATNPPIYRLSAYADTTDLSSEPNWVLYGHLDLEGSMGSRFYEFTDSVGETTAYYSPDISSDEDEPCIEVDRKGKMKKYPAKPDYWLDQVKVRRGGRHMMPNMKAAVSHAENNSVKTLKVKNSKSDSTEVTHPDTITEK